MNMSCGEPTLLRLSDLHPDCIKLGVDVFGYLAPVLALLVTVMNVLIVIVFMRPHIRSHTTFILTLIACADTLDIVCPTGVFAYIYLFGHYKEYLRCSQLEWAYILGEICVDMFNMCSLWLTVLLAFMRCRCINSPFVAKQAHSLKRTVVYLVSILTLVIALHVPSFFIFDFKQIQYVNKEMNETMVVCAMQESNGKFLKTCSERKMQLVMETLLDSILPCVLLVYFNCAMLFTLKKANESRSSLRCNNSFRQDFNKVIKEDDVREDDIKDKNVEQTTVSCNDKGNVNSDRTGDTALNGDTAEGSSNRNGDTTLNSGTINGNSGTTGDTNINGDTFNGNSGRAGDTGLNGDKESGNSDRAGDTGLNGDKENGNSNRNGDSVLNGEIVNRNSYRTEDTAMNDDTVHGNSKRNGDTALGCDTVYYSFKRSGDAALCSDTTITNVSVNMKSFKVCDTSLNDAIHNLNCDNSGNTNLTNTTVSVHSNTNLNYDITNIASDKTDFTADTVNLSSSTIDLDSESTDCNKDEALHNRKVNKSDIIKQDNESNSDAVFLELEENNQDKKTVVMNFKRMCKCFTCQRPVKKNDRNRVSSDSTIDKLDRESRRTSWLILCVSSIIVIHEVPLVVLNIYNLMAHTDKPLPLSNGCFSIVLLLWQFVTYPAIFLIYACMSGAFRSELWKMFTCKTNLGKSRLTKKRKSFVCPCSVRKKIVRKEGKREISRDCI